MSEVDKARTQLLISAVAIYRVFKEKAMPMNIELNELYDLTAFLRSVETYMGAAETDIQQNQWPTKPK